MHRDIINAPTVQSVVDDALRDLPSVLHSHRPALKARLAGAVTTHASVRLARQRKSDPIWAQVKFAEGKALYRFDEGQRDRLMQDIKAQYVQLALVAALAKSGGASKWEAAAFMRGLPHQHGEIYAIGNNAQFVIERARKAALLARRYEALRSPTELPAGGFVATRCISIDSVIRLGRAANNCLSKSEDHWDRMASAQIDIWSILDGRRLVAILEVDLRDKSVVLALGPANAPIGAADVRNVALFCQTSRFAIGEGCKGLRLEYASEPVIGPTMVVLKRRIALYTEWENAARIDISPKCRHAKLGITETTTLDIAFDPKLSPAEERLSNTEACSEIAQAGCKQVRQIVRHIALAQKTSTLVQHRVLALTA